MPHTRGPWRVAENLFGNTASYEVYTNVETKSDKGGYTRICQVTPRDQKANARLIAAAPEMLEVLEWLAEEFDRRDLGDGAMFCGSDIEQVKSAIRKARGEA